MRRTWRGNVASDPVFGQVDDAHTVATLNLGGSATTSAAFVLSAGAP
jgi:hypothetical protein